MQHLVMSRLVLFLSLLAVACAQSYNFGVYSVTNAPKNSLVVLGGTSSNGQLTYIKHVDAGAAGLNSGDSGLGSQHNIIVKGNFIFSTNPRGNSISIFSISPTDPTNVTLINTAPSNGDFPVSVGAHPTDNVVAVVNSGANNTVQLYTYSSAGLVVLPAQNRPLNIKLTTPPAFHTGPAQISFTPDGKGLVVSNKGANPPLILFTYSNRMISSSFVTTANLGMVSFGFAFDTDGTIVIVDAAPVGTFGGVELVSIAYSPAATISFLLQSYYLLPDHAACWVERAPKNGLFYVINAGSNNISVVSRSGSTLTWVTDVPSQLTGPTDNAIATIGGTDYLFVEAKGQNITVFSLGGSSPTFVQLVSLQPTSAVGNGVAVYVGKGSSGGVSIKEKTILA